MSLHKAAPTTVATLKVKMEPDRKRSATQSVDDLAPPTKRQAVNGGSKSSADSLPWNDDLESYQKDAILREMQAYKREKNFLETQLNDIRKRSVEHDDHLRVVDAWWSQLLDEVTLLSNSGLPAPAQKEVSFFTRFENSAEFSSHLSKKSREIKDKVTQIVNNLSASGSSMELDIQDVKNEVARLLAEQKDHMVQIDKLRADNEDLTERLEDATLRYFKAEKARDRIRSKQVTLLEEKALQKDLGGARNDSDKTNGTDSQVVVNGVQEDDSDTSATRLAYKEAAATVTKQKEQLDELLIENKTLTEQLTSANMKLASLSDEDYARTELFKNFKAQHEEVIKRINHLEATNIQLREEAEKLQAERTAYRTQLQNEAESLSAEIESQLQRTEADLTRVRSARDELLADQSMLKANQEQERLAAGHMKELVGAKDDRITSLESEVQRLRSQVEEQSCEPTPKAEIDELDVEELRKKYVLLEQAFASVNNELPAMEKAYKRSMALSSKRVMDFAALEQKVSMVTQERAKADQKYFAARKDKDYQNQQIKDLKLQTTKASEMVSHLKDVEESNRTLLTNHEKQLSDMRHANTTIMAESKKMEAANSDLTSKTEILKVQVSELTNLSKTKDATTSTLKEQILSLETSLTQLRAKHQALSKEKDMLKARSKGDQTAEEKGLWHIAMCNVCNINFKDTALKVCGHTFCASCVDDRLSNRLRKCPSCNKPFDKFDRLTVYLNG